ncbi:MAG: phosphodiester glycosidase family protein [Coriobacteriales bacterium]|jgi:hypothetical protein|nr:phosphodiester glycosidase family protein [Coriobacteriales bacterium]
MRVVRDFFAKPFRWALCFGLALTLAFAGALADTFLIARRLTPQVAWSSQSATAGSTAGSTSATSANATDADGAASGSGFSVESENTEVAAEITATSYKDANITITLEYARIEDTDVYIAEVWLSDVGYLRSAFAQGDYGRNIKADTSQTAAEVGAILAINGDFYGSRDDSWVLRNGQLFRSSRDSDPVLAVDANGDFTCLDGDELSQDSALEQGLWQVWSFGPPLVEDGQIAVSRDQEILGRAANSNPRTAIGQIDERHYLLVVSDGRTDDNAGLSLYQLASVFAERGCQVAYNLDGGGSSTMYFNGEVINNPTSGKRSSSEREVSDIVYIGY